MSAAVVGLSIELLRRRLLRPAVGAAAGLAVAAGVAGPAAASPTGACYVLPKAVVSALIDEEAKTLLDGQATSCRYGRASERPATEKTTVVVLLVTNPSVAAAEKVQATTAKIVPKRAPAGVSRFSRQDVPTSGGNAFFVYWTVAGSAKGQTITNAQAFLQVGATIAQLTFDVFSRGDPSFTADELRRVLPAVAVRIARRS